jgi:hypothetical protein
MPAAALRVYAGQSILNLVGSVNIVGVATFYHQSLEPLLVPRSL